MKTSKVFTENEFNEKVKMYWKLMITPQFKDIECPPIEHDRAKRRTNNLGKAHYAPSMKFSFSFRMLDGRFSVDTIDDIIKHEVGHFLAKFRYGFRQGHNENFKKIAREFGFNGGATADIQIVEGFKETSVTKKVIQRSPSVAKYRVYCTSCGKEWFKSRKSKLINYPQTYICPCKARKTLKVEVL